MELLSTQQAAERLGIHVSRVKVLIGEGRLPTMRVGRAHLIKAEDLPLVANRKTGRPKLKAEAAGAAGQGDATNQVVQAESKPKRKAAKKKGVPR